MSTIYPAGTCSRGITRRSPTPGGKRSRIEPSAHIPLRRSADHGRGEKICASHPEILKQIYLALVLTITFRILLSRTRARLSPAIRFLRCWICQAADAGSRTTTLSLGCSKSRAHPSHVAEPVHDLHRCRAVSGEVPAVDAAEDPRRNTERQRAEPTIVTGWPSIARARPFADDQAESIGLPSQDRHARTRSVAPPTRCRSS